MRVVLLNKVKNRLVGGLPQSMIESGYKVLDFSEHSEISEGDSVLFFSGGQEQEVVYKTINELPENILIGWWMCDYRSINHFNKKLYGKFNYIFLAHKCFFNDFMKLATDGVYYMPQSGFKYKNRGVGIGDWDSIFIGGTGGNPYHTSRPNILKLVSESSKLKIISNQGTSIDQSEFYLKTPLSISISESYMIGGCSNRLYNIIASGGCAFVKYFEGLELLFENHKHLIWFKDNSEIKPLIGEYLSSPNKIEEIKKNARKIFLEKHTGKHRLDNMFDIMENKTNEFKGYL